MLGWKRKKRRDRPERGLSPEVDHFDASIIRFAVKLLLSRRSWVRREIVSLDFDNEFRSYLERLTIDVDQSIVEAFRKDYGLSQSYIPLGWREKGPIYSVDCKSADGRSLRLLNRSFNESFSEYMFWMVSAEAGYSKEAVPKEVQDYVSKGIQAGVENFSSFEVTSDRTWSGSDSAGVWNAMLELPQIERVWNVILRRHIVVARIPQGVDYAIIKMSEVRSYSLCRGRLGLLSPVLCVQTSGRSAGLTKVRVPSDVRVLLCSGLRAEAQDGTKKLSVDNMKIEGDGKWAVHYSREPAAAYTWQLLLVPHRGPLILPGVMALFVELLALLLWGYRDISVFSPESIGGLAHSITLAMVLALSPLVPTIVLSQSARSHVYRAITWKYASATWAGLCFLLSFPLLPPSHWQEAIKHFCNQPIAMHGVVMWIGTVLRGLWIIAVGLLATWLLVSSVITSTSLFNFVRKAKKWLLERCDN